MFRGKDKANPRRYAKDLLANGDLRFIREAWHNNHHAFPTSARHGLGRRQLDPSAWLITALERCHLAWDDVVRISAARQQAKRGPAAATSRSAAGSG